MYDLRISIEGAKFPGELVPINQFQSLPTLMPVLGSGTSAQPFATAADYDRFLHRMREYIVWSDQAIANMRKGLAQNLSYPRVLMEKVLPQLKELIVADPQASLFYSPLKKFPDAVAAADRTRLQAAYRDAITKEINPAYQRLHDFIRDEYLKGARTQVGWSNVPNGRDWYAYLAKQSTTTDLAPDAIHEIGLKEVARIRGEMEQVKAQVGFKGDLAAFFKFLQDDPRFYYDNADALVQGFRDLKKNIDAKLPKLFSDFPKADYEVRAVEPFRAQSAAGGFYQPPSADGSRPGIFYVNTFNLKAQPKFGMETLSLHEAAPGHHFQIAIQQELDELPRFRRFGNGYVAYQEGWALYAESHRQGARHVHRSVPVLRPARRRACCARCGWSWTRACTRRTGPASSRSSTCSRTRRWRRATPSRKSSATSRSRARRSATRSDSCASASCATRRRQRSAHASTCASSTASCCAMARCRWLCWRRRSIGGSRIRNREDLSPRRQDRQEEF